MSDSYVKTIKFDADTTKVLDKVAKLNVVVEGSSKKFAKGFISPEVMRNLSEFRKGLMSAFDISSSEHLKDLEEKLARLLDQKQQLQTMQTSLQGQMSNEVQGSDKWNELNKALESVTEKLEDVNDKLFDTQDDINIEKEQNAKDFAGNLGKAAGKKVTKVFEKIGETIKNFLISMFKEALQKMEDIASYDLANSVKFNQEAVDLATQYGLVGKDAYSAQKAAEQMGYGDVDTLIDNMWNMNEKEIAEFNKLQKQYALSYERDKQTALEYQKFTQEWSDFKEEFQMELLEWFSGNKDTIKRVLNSLMDFMKFVLDLLGAIADAFGTGTERTDSQRAAAANDIINSYKNTNTNNNVNVSNTFNVSGDKLQSNQELANAGSTTYRQIINAFK